MATSTAHNKVSKGMDSYEKFFKEYLTKQAKVVKPRRKMLLEKNYTLPSSGDMAVMDLYALYTLWWQVGSGKESYGYVQTNISNHGKMALIDRYFEEALAKISHTFLVECRAAIADEMENIFDEHLLDANIVVDWLSKHNYIRRFGQLIEKGGLAKGGSEKWFSVFSYGDTISIFLAPFWKHANLYGGPKWAEITLLVRDLDDAIRRGNDKDLMFAVDKLLDLEHNTGSVTTKLKTMKIAKKTLDLRAAFRSAADFIPYVSPQVSKLIKRLA